MKYLFFLFILPGVFSYELTRPHLSSELYRISDSTRIVRGKTPFSLTRPLPGALLLKRSEGLPEELYRDLKFQSSTTYPFTPLFRSALRFSLMNNRNQESYWYNQWTKNEPLLTPGFLSGFSRFLIHCEMDIRHDFFTGFSPDKYTNIPLGEYWYQQFDFNFPIRGYITAGLPHLNVLMGRDRLQTGPSYKSSLMISGESPYYNQFLLSWNSAPFNAYFFLIPMESYLTKEEEEDHKAFYNSNPLYPKGNFGKPLDSRSKFLTGHRYEFSLFDSLLLSFTDMLLIGGRDLPLEDIPPVMFYHNVYGENYSNVMIGLDLFWTPVKGLGLYGELIIDDIRNSFEDSYSVPTSLGYSGGFRYTFTSLPGFMTLHGEAAHTDKHTYKRWSPLLSFYQRRKYLSTGIGENRVLDTPIGFFLGPDANFVSFWFTWDIYPSIFLEGGWEFQSSPQSSYSPPDEIILSYSEERPTDYITVQVLYVKGKYVLNSHISFSFNTFYSFIDENFCLISFSTQWTL